MTRMGLANAESILASPTCESGLADTEVVVGQLDAVQAVARVTGTRETLVYVSLAPFSCESRRAVTAVTTHPVHAGPIVQTFRRGISQPHGWSTVIFIDLTKNT